MPLPALPAPVDASGTGLGAVFAPQMGRDSISAVKVLSLSERVESSTSRWQSSSLINASKQNVNYRLFRSLEALTSKQMMHIGSRIRIIGAFYPRFSKSVNPVWAFFLLIVLPTRKTRSVRVLIFFYFTPQAEAIDCFAENWSSDFNWAVPHVHSIARCLRFMLTSGAHGVLGMPE
jgi:hypothetical protein